MPYTIGKSDQCPAGKPHAVMKEGESEPMGCHPTKADAQKQMAALMAKEPMMNSADIRIPRDNLIRELQADVEVREGDGGGPPRMSGWLIRYGEWAEIDSLLEGRFMERFAPGSMRKTLTERAPKVLFQHGRDALGKQPIGRPVEFDHSDEGVRYEVELYDGVPDLVVSGLRDGAYGISFQFSVMREDKERSPARSDHNPEGMQERTIREASVAEFGPVTFPAYAGSTATVRSATDEFFVHQLATQPDKLRRLIDWLDRDAPDVGGTPPEAGDGGQEADAHLERDADDNAPPEETPDSTSTSPQGRRDTSTGRLVLPRTPKPTRAGVLPNRDEGEETWSPIRLP